jgi:hypothetical protein
LAPSRRNTEPIARSGEGAPDGVAEVELRRAQQTRDGDADADVAARVLQERDGEAQRNAHQAVRAIARGHLLHVQPLDQHLVRGGELVADDPVVHLGREIAAAGDPVQEAPEVGIRPRHGEVP